MLPRKDWYLQDFADDLMGLPRRVHLGDPAVAFGARPLGLPVETTMRTFETWVNSTPTTLDLAALHGRPFLSGLRRHQISCVNPLKLSVRFPTDADRRDLGSTPPR